MSSLGVNLRANDACRLVSSTVTGWPSAHPHAQRAVPVGQLYDGVDHLRQAVAGFTELYNTGWLIERLGHRTPRESYLAATFKDAA